MNLLTFLNMHLNELQNAVIQNLATDGNTTVITILSDSTISAETYHVTIIA